MEIEDEIDFSCMRKATALTIAGSDSGGNAGVQADLRAFHVFGVHGCTVFTALTAQTPFEVQAVALPDPDFVGAQLDAVLGVYDVLALKTGMLANAANIEVVADRLSSYSRISRIVDPVMVATSGAKLLEDDAVAAMKEKLLPLAALITPNLPEAAELSGRREVTADEMPEVARELADLYGAAVLIKGGHCKERAAEDIFFDGAQMYRLTTPLVEDPLSTHGTGCSLSAAITASAAVGKSPLDAVIAGKAYVYEAIRTGVQIGEVCTVMGTPAQIPVEAVRVEEIAVPKNL